MSLEHQHIRTGVITVTGVLLAVPAIAIGKAAGTVIGVGCGIGAAYMGAHYLTDKYAEALITKAKEKYDGIRSFDIRGAFRRSGADHPAEVVPAAPVAESVVSRKRAHRSKRT